jgi:hypothetical protein
LWIVLYLQEAIKRKLYEAIDSVIQPQTISKSLLGRRKVTLLANGTFVQPLIVSDETYEVVSDVFLHGKCFKSVNKSCLNLFWEYQQSYEYPSLLMAK